MEVKILQERHLIQDNCPRRGLPSSHNTNCKEFGSAFRSRGRHSSNETGQGVFETCLAPGTNTHLGIHRVANNTHSDTRFIHTQVHILVPLGLSFAWLVEPKSSSSVNIF